MERERQKRENAGIDSEVLSFILDDYHKHVDLDQVIVDRSDKYLERYITIISGAVGAILALSELTRPQSISWYVGGTIVGIPLIIGWASFTRLITYDFYLRRSQEHREEIMARLVGKYPELQEYYPVPHDELFDADYQRWASVRSIIRRAITYAGTKTIIAAGNSIILAVECFLASLYALKTPIWPTAIGLSFAAFLGAAMIHMGYAKLRYKLHERYFRSSHS